MNLFQEHNMNTSIILAGVGGQGILLAAKIISSAAGAEGFAVASNEIHGMAQRGGSVVAQLRFGENIHSPLILEGTADALFALEHIEALRWAHYLKKGGFAAVNSQIVIPVTVSSGAAEYPSDVERRLNKVFTNMKYCNCVEKAESLGDRRLANTILTGVLANALCIGDAAWKIALAENIKPALLNKNTEAFELGRSL